MTLVTYLHRNGFISKPYNTNNAWGFGGIYGSQYCKGNMKVIIGQYYYRHIQSSQALKFEVDGNGVPGVNTKDEIIKYIEDDKTKSNKMQDM